MNTNLSTFLNLSRWLAAFFVLISHVRHLVMVDFNDVKEKTLLIKGLYFLTGLGHEAVVVFFVISGYLVGALTFEKWRTRGPNLRMYAVARFSRIYTVLLPALLVGLAFDLTGLMWFNASELYTNSVQYKTMVLNFVISDAIDAGTFFANLFMLQGVLTGSLGSNGPLWSLSYEWWYYCLFALVAEALTGKSKYSLWYSLSAIAIVVLLPPKMILWGSLWGLGMVAHAWIKKGAYRPPPLLGIGIFLMAILISRVTHNVENVTNQESLWAAFIRDFLLAVGFVFALVSASRLNREVALPKLHAWLADFSFSTYLFHFPAMLFIVAVGYQVFGLKFQLQPDALGVSFLVAQTLVLYIYCWGLSMLTERHTNLIRRKLS